MTIKHTIHNYTATYADGRQYKLAARSVSEAVLSAAELNSSRVIKVIRQGEWY